MATLERLVVLHYCSQVTERRRKSRVWGEKSDLITRLWLGALGWHGHFRSPRCGAWVHARHREKVGKRGQRKRNQTRQPVFELEYRVRGAVLERLIVGCKCRHIKIWGIFMSCLFIFLMQTSVTCMHGGIWIFFSMVPALKLFRTAGIKRSLYVWHRFKTYILRRPIP